MCPGHSFHWIIARVDYSALEGETKIKVTSIAMPLPNQMARLEIVLLRPLVYCPEESLTRQTTRVVVSFGDLSRSPRKISSPSPENVALAMVQGFALFCETADSQELYIFVVSVSEAKV
jgi:hypothetical protein